MYHVYIIKSEKDLSYYVGQTNDLKDRLLRHNEGRNKYTRNKLPWKLVYSKEYKTRSEAMKNEKEIKNKKSRKYIEWLINK